MVALGNSYKLGKNILIYRELEYCNFTVHARSKETLANNEKGVDKLNSATSFCLDASYSINNVNYVGQITTTYNKKATNFAGFDIIRATDDISSFVGISSFGLTFGLKISLQYHFF